jgi:glycosyltransferase involved in cell wall biosynthesis
VRVLQHQRAETPPYAHHVTYLQAVLTPCERLLGRVLPESVATALGLFLRRNDYDAVVTVGHRVALAFGLLRRLFGSRSAHIAKELFLDEAALRSPRKRRLARAALRACDGFIVNCRVECRAYSDFLGVDEGRFRFLPWPSNLDAQDVPAGQGYVFAAGRSFRDWETLFAAARQVRAEFVVVAAQDDVAGLSVPPNVRLHLDVPRARYLQLLRDALVVAVPLKQTVRSVGQVVILEAMALGKAVVPAAVPGVLDYVADGETALLYEPGDAGGLAAQLGRVLADAGLRVRIARAGQTAVRTRYNRWAYARDMLQTVQSVVWHRARRAPR